MKKNHIASLTGIRFFLAVWVLLFHTVDVWKDFPFLYNLFSNGYVAVSAFFVLSGFILVYNYANLETDAHSLKMFSLARIIRLYPMYLISIIVAFPLFAYFQYKTETGYIGIIILTTLLTVFGLQAWYKPVLEKLNPPSWSLSVEFFFYSLFPFLNKKINSLSKRGIYIMIGFCFLITFFLMHFIVQGIKASSASEIIQTGTFPLLHIFTFLTGMGFGYLYYVHEVSFFKKYSDLIAIILISGIALSLVYNWFPLADINNGGFAVFFSLFFIAITYPSSIVGKFLSHRVFVLLGEASYSLYILHLVIYNYLKIGFTNFFNYTDFESFSFLGIYLVIAIITAVLSFLFIEKKLTIYLKKKFIKPASTKTSSYPLVLNNQEIA